MARPLEALLEREKPEIVAAAKEEANALALAIRLAAHSGLSGVLAE